MTPPSYITPSLNAGVKAIAPILSASTTAMFRVRSVFLCDIFLAVELVRRFATSISLGELDFPRLSGHKKCREGVHCINQEKAGGGELWR